jgi:signal transduction histidine kinase/ActR/RegA family two-component response regulator
VSDADRAGIEHRLLFLAPTDRDATMTASILGRAGVTCASCADLDEICRKLDSGAGAVMLPEEAVVVEQYDRLSDWLANQPPWSDLPVLVLARPGADSAAVAQAMDRLGNVTVLERPTRVSALVSTARTALRARQRQYQIRDYLSELVLNQQALREADQRKDEFLAILAHELRNPLAPILNSLNLLKLTSAQDTSTQRATAMMERQVNHMVRLVDDLLEVSRISRGKIELRKGPIELNAIVRSALETSRPHIDAAGQYLLLEFPPEPLMLEGDFVRLTQVVSNLLNNAAKYSDPGGRIWLTVQREGGTAVISVRDMGRGIPPDKLPHVFELFMQVDQQPNRPQGGLGIGLTLVKRLVEMHGGSIEGRSEGTGKGAEFIVRLPLSAVSPALDPPAEPAVPTFAISRRVLVVDDNRDAAESLAMLLKHLGAEVFVSFNGPDALEAIAKQQPTIVLLDIGMPGMDGFEVARHIRQRSTRSELRLVALTGWGQDEDRRRSLAAGFDQHLTKPVDISDLQKLLAFVKDSSEASRASH